MDEKEREDEANTFGGEFLLPENRLEKVFYKYILVTFFTFFVNLVVFWLLFSVFQYWYLISQAVSTVVVILLNYTINKKITFQN